MRKTFRPLGFGGIAIIAALVACGGSDAGDVGSPADDVAPTDPTPDAGDSVGSFGGPGGDASAADAGACAATVAQVQKPKVDFIFVIDDSGSMTEEMDQIKANVNAFAKKIATAGLDYHVIFITKRATSAAQTGNVICVPAPLAGPNCSDNLPAFVHVNQDVQSTNSLSLVLSTYDSPNASLAWNKHLRYEATKVFVEVTDDTSALTAAQFDAQLLAKAPAGMFGTTQARRYAFHSIVSKPFAEPIPSTKVCSTAARESVEYQRLSKLTGGLVDEVCKTSYSAVLDKIAKKVVEKLGCELAYPTAEAADPKSVVVQYTPAEGTTTKLTQVDDPAKCATVPDGWYYDDPADPTRIILCPAMCVTVNAARSSKRSWVAEPPIRRELHAIRSLRLNERDFPAHLRRG